MTGLSIDLRFVREHGFLSDLIDRGTGGVLKGNGPRWSHVGSMTVDGKEFGARSGVDKAFSGQPGVQFRPGDYAKFADEDIVSIPVTRTELDEYWRLARLMKGCPYSRRTILGFVVGRNVPDPPTYFHDRTTAFDCSTLQAWLLLHAGANVIWQGFRDELRQISPNRLYDIARDARFYRRSLNAIGVVTR